LLRKFGVKTPVDYPDNLYDGDLPFPKLLGNNIEEHFEQMAGEFIDEYVVEADRFAECRLPKAPGFDDIIFQPGWTRYTFDGQVWHTESVPHPLEKAYVFDTETTIYLTTEFELGMAILSKTLNLRTFILTPFQHTSPFPDWHLDSDGSMF
jgi:hypothetical protein